MKHIAVITGASSGIGQEFVRQFGQGAGGPLDELWLIARNKEKLEAVAEASPLTCRVLACDLTDEASFAALERELAKEDGLRVEWLINSAGFGKTGDFAQVAPEDNAAMVKLNCLAVVEMCQVALAYMGPGSRIINMASIAGSLPLPQFSVYSASKAFVETFSRALDEDLYGTGIHVTAVCPKWMRTNFIAAVGDEAAYERMTGIGFEDPAHAVRAALRAAVAGRALCVPSPDMRVAHALCRILPAGVLLAGMAALASARSGK